MIVPAGSCEDLAAFQNQFDQQHGQQHCQQFQHQPKQQQEARQALRGSMERRYRGKLYRRCRLSQWSPVVETVLENEEASCVHGSCEDLAASQYQQNYQYKQFPQQQRSQEQYHQQGSNDDDEQQPPQQQHSNDDDDIEEPQHEQIRVTFVLNGLIDDGMLDLLGIQDFVRVLVRRRAEAADAVTKQDPFIACYYQNTSGSEYGKNEDDDEDYGDAPIATIWRVMSILAQRLSTSPYMTDLERVIVCARLSLMAEFGMKSSSPFVNLWPKRCGGVSLS